MRLTEAAFTEKLATACACGGQGFEIRAYVAMRQPMLEGELHGQYAWAYKGEELVHGTFCITCTACKKVAFDDACCPRCDAPDGLAVALDAENAFEVPKACPSCHAPQVNLVAYVPVRVPYKGTRAQKAWTNMRPEDPGFHAYRVECKSCQNVLEQKSPCPLCAR